MRGTVWVVISTVGTLGQLIVALWPIMQSYFYPSKNLEIDLIERTTFAGFADATKNSLTSEPIETYYEGRKIPNHVVLRLRIANTGSKPISSFDYEEDIQLYFENTIEIMTAKKTASYPKHMEVFGSGFNKRGGGKPFITLKKALLNPDDWYVLEFNVVPESGKTPVIEPTGRLFGIKQIIYKESTEQPKKERNLLPYIYVSMMILTIVPLVIYIYKLKKQLNRYITLSL
jgi:hypothetical protein